MIIFAHLKADLIARAEPIAGCDASFGPADGLIGDRCVMGELAARGLHDQIAARVNRNCVGTGHRKPDRPRIRARRDGEVVFELPLVAVVDEINPWIDGVVFDLRVIRNASTPALRVIADQIIGDSREPVVTAYRGMGIRSKESRLDDQ